MCIKIFKNNSEQSYDCKTPIEQQVNGATEVRVNYQPNDKEIEKFLQEVERCANNGSDLKMNLKITYNGFLDGFKLKKQLKKAMNDISLNQVIKLMALGQLEADKKLEELSSICLNRECNVK